MGWVDWLRVAAVACYVIAGLLFIAIVLAIFVGIPVLLLGGLLRLLDGPAESSGPKPPATAPAE